MNPPQFSLDTALLQAATAIVKTLRRRGYPAYFVGGCVRDLVMGCEPKDVDIATSATPDVVQEIFPNTVAVGAQFGVVIVILDGVHFEVTTFRSDSTYSDGRHPDFVSYATSPEEDARRRDFTINALFYDPLEGRLLDFHAGQSDIEKKIVRAIGNPLDRFQEDKLRILRAVRFAVRFHSEIEASTRQAIVERASEINQVSAERLRDELTRILIEGQSHRGFVLLDELGLLKQVLPEIVAMKGVAQPPEFHPEGDVWVHTLLLLKLMDETKAKVSRESGQRAVGSDLSIVQGGESEPKSEIRSQKTEIEEGTFSCRPDTRHLTPDIPLPWLLEPDTYPSPLLAWGTLLHDVGKPATFERADRIRFNGHTDVGARMVRQIARRLRMSNEESDVIAELVQEHLKFKDVQRMRSATLKRFVRRQHFAEHLELHRLDCLASHGNLEAFCFTRDFARSLKPDEARPKPLLTGHDLMELGYIPGPEFKKILTALEDAQLESLIVDRESALEFLKQKFPLS